MPPTAVSAPGASPDEPNPNPDAVPSGVVPPPSGMPPESNPLMPDHEALARLDGFELTEAPTGSVNARKGVREVVMAINWLIVNKRLRQAQAHQVCQVLTKLGLDTIWNLNADDKSRLGFTRAVADVMGLHAIRLDRAGVKKGGMVFKLPSEPITPAWLAARGINLDLGTGA